MELPHSLSLIAHDATRMGLRLNDRLNDLSLEAWVATGRELYHSGEFLTWWLADWAAYGEKRYGRLKEFCEANNVNYQTLSNLAHVARNVEFSRRRETLSFSHHVEVAPLPARDQVKWLAKAEREKWPVVELRRQIRASTMIHPPEQTFGPRDEGVALQKLFLDAGAVLDKHERFFKGNPQEAWEYAEPFLRKAAKLFPDRIQLNS